MNIKDIKTKKFATRCIHAGVKIDGEARPVKRPLIMSNNNEQLLGTSPWAYARDGNANQRWLEERLIAMEGGEECVVTSSGVSAINGTLLTLLSSGDHIICPDTSYFSVHEVTINDFPKRFGIQTTLVDTSDPENVRKPLTPRTKIIHLETPGNPTVHIADIAAISRIAREAGALLSVDSTWSGLTTQHPFELGADLVMHSLSKYINGHGDALGGAVLGPKALIDKIRWFAVKNLGACISPFNAWQIMRGSATLPMRMERHCANAMKVAEFLERHPKVAWVRYPGLKSHPQHAIARKQMTGYSGMLNFDIKGDPEQRREMAKRLEIFTWATCLGHDESLLTIYDDYHGNTFFRVSIGLEDPEDLTADLDQALAIVKPA